MGQLAFFSAETDEPSLDDFAGLLAAHGQSAISTSGTRVSVVVADAWRAMALVDELRVTGVTAEVVPTDEGNLLARSARTHALDELHRRWSAGAVKAMPPAWLPSPRALRLWVLAAGVREGDRYFLGVDPHAPDTHAPLATALMRVGIAPTLVGSRSRNPGLRISGKRRLVRLMEYVGAAPEFSEAEQMWPHIGL